LPQSIQNFDCSSFSRPQKPQGFTRSSPIASRNHPGWSFCPKRAEYRPGFG
jgi:hypothetical protein